MEKKLDYNKICTLGLIRIAKFFHDLRNKNDAELIADMICSICADEADLYIKDKDKPVLDAELCFKYKGFTCELSSCNILTTTEQFKQFTLPRGLFTDRYVCWLWGHKDIDGKTLKEYLKENPKETLENNYWVCEIYLVPNAWCWGADCDLREGAEVNKNILNAIDKFIQEVGEDNL